MANRFFLNAKRGMRFLLPALLFIGSNNNVIAQSKPRNVIVIIVDDLRTDLGSYGNNVIKTPVLDALAASSIRFTKAYCQQAVCAPSRVSLLTGQYAGRLGIHDLQTPLRSVEPDIATIPMLFKEAGFETISVGKVYHHGNDDKESWTVLNEGIKSEYGDAATISHRDSMNAALSKAGKNPDFRGPAYEASNGPDDNHTDYKRVDAAIKQIKAHKDKPFLLMLGLAKPHLPFVAPKKYWDLYDGNAIPMADKRKPEGASQYAGTSWGEMRAYSGIPSGTTLLTDEQSRILKHGYYACVSFIDAQVGRLLAALKEMHLDENTMIVFTSDHGYKLGEYTAWCKHTNYELDTHIPMMIKMPGMSAGTVCNSLVQNADIMPTLVEVFGLRKTQVQGKSLVPVMNNSKMKIHEYALSQYPRGGKTMGYSLTDGNYRYTAWVDVPSGEIKEAELYDHRSSDIAVKNLSGEKSIQDLEAKFAKAVATYIAEMKE